VQTKIWTVQLRLALMECIGGADGPGVESLPDGKSDVKSAIKYIRKARPDPEGLAGRLPKTAQQLKDGSLGPDMLAQIMTRAMSGDERFIAIPGRVNLESDRFAFVCDFVSRLVTLLGHSQVSKRRMSPPRSPRPFVRNSKPWLKTERTSSSRRRICPTWLCL